MGKVLSAHGIRVPGHGRSLSVYNPRQKEIMELRAGLIAMVVVAALILSCEAYVPSSFDHIM